MLIGTPFLASIVLPGLAGSPPWLLAAGVALSFVAVAIAVHDLTTMLIPDRYTAALAVIALLILASSGVSLTDLLIATASAVAAGLALYLVGVAYGWLRGQSGIGFGDIKLIAASALLVGLGGIGLQMLLATMSALIFVVIRALRRRRPLRASTRIPFGAFLAPAAVIVWAWFPIV